MLPRSIPTRHGRRWTEWEEAELVDLLGTISTRAIAVRLGRTVGAVWSRSSTLRVSPYLEDGRYTASEVARTLGVPVNTVLRWCQRGYLPARKVGRRGRGGMWRIDWDISAPLVLHTPRTGSTMRLLRGQRTLRVVRALPRPQTKV